MKIAPWLVDLQTKLEDVIATNHLPHALLLTGSNGLGKSQLADWLAMRLLCAAEDVAKPCGVCRSCRPFLAGAHPDVVRVERLPDKKVIGVDQVRDANRKLALTAERGGVRVAIINPAEALHHNAANALLKTLEEPKAGTILLLVSSRPGRLPATILSRCQQLSLPSPAVAQAKAWLLEQDATASGEATDIALMLARNAPLAALSLMQSEAPALLIAMQRDLQQAQEDQTDLVSIAKRWADDRLPERLDWLGRWCAHAASLTQVEHPADPARLVWLFDALLEAQRALAGNAPPDLTVEHLLASWQQYATDSKHSHLATH